MNIDLSIPIWTIEHVAAALHLSVDAAREYTYLTGFPADKQGLTATAARATSSPAIVPSRPTKSYKPGAR